MQGIVLITLLLSFSCELVERGRRLRYQWMEVMEFHQHQQAQLRQKKPVKQQQSRHLKSDWQGTYQARP